MAKEATKDAAQEAIHLYLGKPLVERLKRHAEKADRSPSYMARLAITQYLDHTTEKGKHS